MFGGESTVLCFDDSLRAKYMRHSMSEESRVYSGAVTDVYDKTKTKLTMPPLLLYPDDTSGYIAILEGGGINFHGYALQAVGGGEFRVVYVEKPDGWRVKGPVATAWKIICSVDSLNELVNCDLVANVCPPPDPKLFPKGLNEDWIKPGKSTWNWWARISSNHETQMMLVDKAAEMGAQYHLVDIGWDQGKTWQDETRDPYDYLKLLCDYAAKKDVGIFAWKCSDVSLNLELQGSPDSKFWNLKPVQVSQNLDEMRAEIKRIADAGARGIVDGDRVRLRSKLSELVMDARLSDNVSPGVALAYGGIWAKLTGGSSINVLIPDYVQPFGGNAAYNSTYIEVEKL